MKRYLFLLLIIIFLTGCSQSINTNEVAIGQEENTSVPEKTSTFTAVPSVTASPTIEPSLTPSPQPTSNYCPPVQALSALEELNDTFVTYGDYAELAISTSKIALPPVVMEMQEIYRNAKEIECPICLLTAHTEMLDGMKLINQGFIDFMAGEKDLAEENIQAGMEHIEIFKSEMERIIDCMPDCKEVPIE